MRFAGTHAGSWAVVCAVLLLAMSAGAQSGDSHLTVDPASSIYQRSVFVHGYAHGYELGFHSGDLDLHMGRPGRDPRSIKMFKDAKKIHRPEFGNRDMFVNGYQQGFRVGYADAYFEREFRGAQEARTLAQQMQDAASSQQVNAGQDARKGGVEFDRGMADGYKKGLSTGLDTARAGRPFNLINDECPRKASDGGLYCQAHRLGYELGYSDGFNNQRRPEEHVKTASD